MENGSQSSSTLPPLHPDQAVAIVLEQISQINSELARADDGEYIRLTPLFTACSRLLRAAPVGYRPVLSTNLGFKSWDLDTLMMHAKVCQHISLLLGPIQPRQLNISLVAKGIPRRRTGPRFAYSNPALPRLAELDIRLASVEQYLSLILSSNDLCSVALTWFTSTSTWMIPGVGYEKGDVLEVKFERPGQPILHEGIIGNLDTRQELPAAPGSRGESVKDSETDEATTPQLARLEQTSRSLEERSRNLEEHSQTLREQTRTLHDENERLRRELDRYATENEILRALQTPKPEPNNIQRTTTELAAISPRVLEDDHTGEALLNAGATWDYIQGHDLFRRGLLDIDNVCERLKGRARTGGNGLVFREGDVNRAIHESKRGRADTLDFMDLDSLSARTSEATSIRSTVTVHQKGEMLGQMLTGIGAVQKNTSATISLISMTSPEADSPWSERDGLPPPYALSPGVFYHTSIEAMMYSSRRS